MKNAAASEFPIVPEMPSACRHDGFSCASLTAGMAQGDEAAFREFHRRYFNRLFRFLLVLMRGHETDASDALQETLCRVVRHIRTFDNEEVLWCWLTVLARSSACDLGRKHQSYWSMLKQYALDWLPFQSHSTLEPDNGLTHAMEECLQKLAPDDRSLIEERYWLKNSLGQMAERHETTEKAIECRLFRIRNILRTAMVNKLKEEP